MDFTLGERQQAVADLAAEVLGADSPRAADPWKELARAGLLDVSPPDGLGVLEVAVLLTEVGRRAPSMQALATLMTGALPLARWGSPDLRADLLRGVASGGVQSRLISSRSSPSAVTADFRYRQPVTPTALTVYLYASRIPRICSIAASSVRVERPAKTCFPATSTSPPSIVAGASIDRSRR